MRNCLVGSLCEGTPFCCPIPKIRTGPIPMLSRRIAHLPFAFPFACGSAKRSRRQTRQGEDEDDEEDDEEESGQKRVRRGGSGGKSSKSDDQDAGKCVNL